MNCQWSSRRHAGRLLLAQRWARSLPRESPRVSWVISKYTAATTVTIRQPPLACLIGPQTHRWLSTAPEPSPSTTGSSSGTPKRARPPLTLLLAVIPLGIGLYLGRQFDQFLLPPAPAAPGSPEDLALAASVRARAATLPLVQQLEADPAWEGWDAYGNLPADDPHRAHRLTTGPLGSAAGVGAYQRVFARREGYDDEVRELEREAVAASAAPTTTPSKGVPGEMATVIYFGAATVGWPGVVHGGCVATVLDETLWRCAVRQLDGRAGVTASLQVSYRSPTIAERFYVIRARPETPEETAAEEERTKKWNKNRDPAAAAAAGAKDHGEGLRGSGVRGGHHDPAAVHHTAGATHRDSHAVGGQTVEKGLFNSSMDSKTENSAMKSLSPTSWLSWLWRRTSEDQKQPGAGNGKPRKIWIRGTLESLDGQVCVEARGLFVVPKGMKLRGVMDGF